MATHAITSTVLISEFAKSIAEKEGFFSDNKTIPSVSKRLKNPGNLRSWRDPQGNPYPVFNGLVEFPSVDIGWMALRAQCKINILKRSLTMSQFFGGKPGVYAGFSSRHGKNSAREYEQFVVAKLSSVFGFDVADRLSAPSGGKMISLSISRLIDDAEGDSR